MTITTRDAVPLRPAMGADVEAITTIWARGWREVHLGHVPPELVGHRRRGQLKRHVLARLGTTTVALAGSDVAGFLTTHRDEVEQLYVGGAARGTGVASALLRHGERRIATTFDGAWLAVVASNTRARRFYERNGWSDRGMSDNPAFTVDGRSILVPAHRYEKQLTASGGRGSSKGGRGSRGARVLEQR